MEAVNENDILFTEKFLHAFKTLDGNELGLIDYEHFKLMLERTYSEEEKEIIQMIEEEDFVHDNKLDFVKLCISLLSTRVLFNKISSENGKVISSKPRINTNTFTRRKTSAQNDFEKNNDGNSKREEMFIQVIRGSIFHLNEDLLGNRYQLEVLENAVVEIFVKPTSNSGGNVCNIPIEVLLFQDNKSKPFISSSSFINSEGFCVMQFNLRKGKYVIIPVLLKWGKVKSTTSTENLDFESLLNIDEQKEASLTPDCEKALKEIYDLIDLDGNGLLSQTEFDLFIQHTSGETAADEWSTIEDNFKMEDGQLTFEGFLELYTMVIQTDPADVKNMFQQMGMNGSLELANAQPFVLVAKSKTTKFVLRPLSVSSYCNIAEKVLRKMAVEQGSSYKVKNMRDLLLYTHKLQHRVTLVIQNQSHSKVTVRLDCNKSQNCQSHQNSLDCYFEVPPRTNMLGHHLYPVDPELPWSVQCTESLK